MTLLDDLLSICPFAKDPSNPQDPIENHVWAQPLAWLIAKQKQHNKSTELTTRTTLAFFVKSFRALGTSLTEELLVL